MAIIAALLALAAWPVSEVQAAPLVAQWTFLQPTAPVASGTDSFEVWVRFRLDANSPSIDYVPGDVSRYVHWGPVPATAYFRDPASGQELTEAVASVDSVWLGLWRFCNSDFWDACSDTGPYRFEPPANPLQNLQNLLAPLHPGDSVDYLWGTFVPQGGVAPDGVYQFSLAPISFELTLTSVTGNPYGSATEYIRNSSCGSIYGCSNIVFERVIATGGSTTVPEPNTAWLALVAIPYVLMAKQRGRRAGRARQVWRRIPVKQ